MKHGEFFDALKQGNIARCYLFEGPEEFTKKSALNKLRDAVARGDFASMNASRLNDPAPDELIAAAETLPFMAEKRFLEIRNCAMLKSEKSKDYDEDAAVKRLDEYMDQLPDTVCMVFYVSGKADGRKKFYNILKKKAVIVSFEALDDKELGTWIRQTLKRRGKTIAPATIQRLVFSVGKDLTLLSNELEKLAAYLGERDEVTEEDIEQVCVHSTEYKVFDLTDVLLSGRGAQAMEMLSALLRDGEERLNMLALLGRQCRQLKYMKALAAEGVSQGTIASMLGMPPFAVRKNAETARRYSAAQLNAMCRLCLDTEYQVKSGQIMEYGSLEKVMLEMLTIRGGGGHA